MFNYTVVFRLAKTVTFCRMRHVVELYDFTKGTFAGSLHIPKTERCLKRPINRIEAFSNTWKASHNMRLFVFVCDSDNEWEIVFNIYKCIKNFVGSEMIFTLVPNSTWTYIPEGLPQFMKYFIHEQDTFLIIQNANKIAAMDIIIFHSTNLTLRHKTSIPMPGNGAIHERRPGQKYLHVEFSNVHDGAHIIIDINCLYRTKLTSNEETYFGVQAIVLDRHSEDMSKIQLDQRMNLFQLHLSTVQQNEPMYDAVNIYMLQT
jgi:hypothetical protein